MTAPTTSTGTRMRCDTCGAEFIVITAGDAELECCGVPPTVVSPGRSPNP
jgi:hypothetical protein